jgi:hypothetical protein
MPHQISWYKEDEIIYLELVGLLSPQELEAINCSINAMLNNSLHRLVLLINAEHISVGYQTVNLMRNSQKYADHTHLKKILTYAPDKLTRLIFLMAFSLTRANLMQFENTEQLQRYLKRPKPSKA